MRSRRRPFIVSPDAETARVGVGEHVVDGEIWSDWRYEAATNEVVLGSHPARLARITIRYDLGRTCPE